MDIQWYPGHMAKTKKSLKENLFLIDIVIEILDARIPISSKNPDIKNLTQNKLKILVLNKSDLADDNITNQFKKYFSDYDYCVALDCLTGKNFNILNKIISDLAQSKIEKLKKRGRIFSPLRLMVVGIPNVGKSTFINKFMNKKIAKVANRPGVTLNKQWIKIRKDIELLDTPGILCPKLDNPEMFFNLAFTGAIKDNNIDKYQIALKLIEKLNSVDKSILSGRFKYKITNSDPYKEIILISKNRGLLKKSGEPDLERASIILLDEFRSGKLGKISLEC